MVGVVLPFPFLPPLLFGSLQLAMSASLVYALTTAPRSTLCVANLTSSRAPWQPSCLTKTWLNGAHGEILGGVLTPKLRKLSEYAGGGGEGQ